MMTTLNSHIPLVWRKRNWAVEKGAVADAVVGEVDGGEGGCSRIHGGGGVSLHSSSLYVIRTNTFSPQCLSFGKTFGKEIPKMCHPGVVQQQAANDLAFVAKVKLVV